MPDVASHKVCNPSFLNTTDFIVYPDYFKAHSYLPPSLDLVFWFKSLTIYLLKLKLYNNLEKVDITNFPTLLP